jgi:hypothetical protein
MKLDENQIAAVREKLGADPLPEDHSAYAALAQNFGEHSFYVSDQGLLIPEPVAEQPDTARLVLIAAWADESKTEIGAIEPQPTDVVVELSPVA